MTSKSIEMSAVEFREFFGLTLSGQMEHMKATQTERDGYRITCLPGFRFRVE